MLEPELKAENESLLESWMNTEDFFLIDRCIERNTEKAVMKFNLWKKITLKK